MPHEPIRRRRFIRLAGVSVMAVGAGCSDPNTDEDDDTGGGY